MPMMTIKEIVKLRQLLGAATDTVQELFNQPITPELLEELAALWDACEEYKVVFENFSHE